MFKSNKKLILHIKEKNRNIKSGIPTKMYSLASFKSLKEIAFDDPSLIYYICHKIDPTKYQIEPFIDVEQDCKRLDKHGITEFKYSKERSTHGVTQESCNFSRYGKNVAIELCQKGICDEISKLITQIKQKRSSTYIDKVVFAQEFSNYFTFDEDPNKVIENKIQELKEKFDIKLPDNNHDIEKKGNHIYIRYSLEENTFCITFIINCVCSIGEKTELKIKANEVDFNFNHNVPCEFCGDTFIISHNLQFCLDIIKKNSP